MYIKEDLIIPHVRLVTIERFRLLAQLIFGRLLEMYSTTLSVCFAPRPPSSLDHY